MPCECDKCKKMFDLKPLIDKYDENMLMSDFLKQEFPPEGTAVCEKCRK